MWNELLGWGKRASALPRGFALPPACGATLERTKKRHMLEAGPPPMQLAAHVSPDLPPMHVCHFGLTRHVKCILKQGVALWVAPRFDSRS